MACMPSEYGSANMSSSASPKGRLVHLRQAGSIYRPSRASHQRPAGTRLNDDDEIGKQEAKGEKYWYSWKNNAF